jgi:hypothetical protein
MEGSRRDTDRGSGADDQGVALRITDRLQLWNAWGAKSSDVPHRWLAGVLLGNYDKTTVLDRQIHEMLQGKFRGEVVFNTTIGRSVRMREATVQGQRIFEHPEGGAQAQQFAALVQEMLNRGSKSKDHTVNPLPDEQIFGKVANG